MMGGGVEDLPLQTSQGDRDSASMPPGGQSEVGQEMKRKMKLLTRI